MSAVIRREVFAGATEGYALPSGAFVVGLPDAAILTGTVDLVDVAAKAPRLRMEAPSPIRYPVLTDGTPRGRCIAGQSQDSGATWEWVEAEGRWSDRGPNGGERPCVYLANGRLIIEPGGQDHPTEGWAGLNPDGFPQRIVRYDQARDIHERTIVGPLVIGQSSVDGIEIQFGDFLAARRYQAEPGDTHTIWAVLEGNVLALATRKLAQNETVCLWVDVNKITELPLAPTKDDGGDDDGDDDHDDDDKDKVMTIRIPQRAKDIVQALYDRHKDLAQGDDNKRRELTRLCAEQLAFEHPSVEVDAGLPLVSVEQVDWGTKRADYGRPPSKDALAVRYKGALWSADCFNGTTREPAVPDEFEALPGQVFIGNGDPLDGGKALTATNHLAIPDDDDDDAGDPALKARVEALEKKYAAVLLTLAEGAKVNEDQWEAIRAIKPQPTSGIKPGDTIEIANQTTTGSAYGHSHRHDRIVGVVTKV